jgi:hypothetical protein
MNIKEVFEFYEKYVKPIYSEIEAKRNNIPVELLFETYAAFDHIKRFYLNHEDESEASMKAIGHLKRGILDAFKLKLKYFNQDIEEFNKYSKSIELIDNGQFISDFIKEKNKIFLLAKEARLTESKKSKENAFEIWFEVSINIDEFENKYLNQLDKIDWANKKQFQWINQDMIRGILIGITSSIIASLLWSLFNV